MNALLYSTKLAGALRAGRRGEPELVKLVESAERDLGVSLITGYAPGDEWVAFAEFVRNAARNERPDVFERLVKVTTNNFVLNAMLAVVTGTGRSGAIRALVANGADESALSDEQKRFLRSVYGKTWRPRE